MRSLNLSKVETTLPYNFLAERLVLGSILINPEAIVIVSQHLNIESFYLKSHQIFYKGALILYGEGKTVNYINLATWLQDHKFTNYIEDLVIIADFLNQVVGVGYLEDYIALIYEKYLRRLIIDLGYGIIESGYSTEVPLESLKI